MEMGFKKIALMVMYDGTVYLNMDVKQAFGRLLHEANFVVVERERDKALEVLKERYEHDLRGKVLTHEEMFQHAARHVELAKADKLYMAYNHNRRPLLKSPTTKERADAELRTYCAETGNDGYVEEV